MERGPISKVTELTSNQVTSTETIIEELIEADETPAVVIVRWPSKPSVFHARRFPDVAATVARLFAEAATRLAADQAGPSAVTTTATTSLVDQAATSCPA
jgi:hypothetical protein